MSRLDRRIVRSRSIRSSCIRSCLVSQSVVSLTAGAVFRGRFVFFKGRIVVVIVVVSLMILPNVLGVEAEIEILEKVNAKVTTAVFINSENYS